MEMTGGIGLFGAFSSLAGDCISLTFDLLNYFENKAFHQKLLGKLDKINNELSEIESDLGDIKMELKDIDDKLMAELSLSIIKPVAVIDSWVTYLGALDPDRIAENRKEITKRAKEMLDPSSETSILYVLSELNEILSFNTIFQDQTSILEQISPNGFIWIQLKIRKAANLLAHACCIDTSKDIGYLGYHISQNLHGQFKGMLSIAENRNYSKKGMQNFLWAFNCYIYPKYYIAKGGTIMYGIDPVFLCPYHDAQPLLDFVVKNSTGAYTTVFEEPVSGKNDQNIDPDQYTNRFYMDINHGEYNFGYPPKCVSKNIDYKKYVSFQTLGNQEFLYFKKSNQGYALLPVSESVSEQSDLSIMNEWDASRKGILGSSFKLTYPTSNSGESDLPGCGFAFAHRRFQKERKGWYLGACNGVPLWVDNDNSSTVITSFESYQLYDGENGPASDKLLVADVKSGKVSAMAYKELDSSTFNSTYWKLMLSFEKDGSSRVLLLPAQCLLKEDQDKWYLSIDESGDWELKKQDGSPISDFAFSFEVPPVLQKLNDPYQLKPAAAHLTCARVPAKIKKVVFHNSPYFFSMD